MPLYHWLSQSNQDQPKATTDQVQRPHQTSPSQTNPPTILKSPEEEQPPAEQTATRGISPSSTQSRTQRHSPTKA